MPTNMNIKDHPNGVSIAGFSGSVSPDFEAPTALKRTHRDKNITTTNGICGRMKKNPKSPFGVTTLGNANMAVMRMLDAVINVFEVSTSKLKECSCLSYASFAATLCPFINR